MSMSNNYVLCVAVWPRWDDDRVAAVKHKYFDKVILSFIDPEVDFAEAKACGQPIVLAIAGQPGYRAIKFLCDDYDKPAELRRVKWVRCLTTGVDIYRISELQKELRGIAFTSVKGDFSHSLAVHVLHVILHFHRQTAAIQADRAARRWQFHLGEDIRSKTVGIIGYGDIGREVARMLQPLGPRVIGVRRNAPKVSTDEYDTHIVSGSEAMLRTIRESDYVVNILPGGHATLELFNKDVFASMRPNAVYINIGRGTTQNEVDLAAALRDGVIRAAALDVCQVEPLPQDSPLWQLPDDKILITSHSACLTKDSYASIIKSFMKVVDHFANTGVIDDYYPNLELGY